VHDLTLAGQFADRLLLLDGGRVATAGPPASVLCEEVLAGHFGPGLQVMRTPGGELVVTARRTGPAEPAVRPPDPGR
jgi:iron complex transport system ATP-binding protein